MEDDPSRVAVNILKFNSNFIKHSLQNNADCVFLLFWGGRVPTCNTIPILNRTNLNLEGNYYL